RPTSCIHHEAHFAVTDFLGLTGKTILVLGAANRKSVAWHIAKLLTDAGATVIHSVRSEQRRQTIRKLAGPEAPVFVCDVERQEEINRLRDDVSTYLSSGGRQPPESLPASDNKAFKNGEPLEGLRLPA